MKVPNDGGERLLRQVLSLRVKLLAYIQAIVRRRDLAEDVFQDLCVLVLQKQDELASHATLDGWLRTAARQLAWNAARKKANRSLLLGEQVHELMEAQWSRFDGPADSTLGDALEDCVRALRPEAREMLKAHYVDGATYAELSGRLKRPVESLYVTMSRIHKRLADCILRRVGKGLDHA
jgi:RNA polymerase sigma-70 factor (ECF subfamily)